MTSSPIALDQLQAKQGTLDMEDYTIVDAVVAVVILISAFLAFSRGFVRETLSILGWVAAAVAGYIFAPKVEPMIREIPVLSDILGGSCQLSILAAFAAVFAVALVVVSIFTPLFSGLIQKSALGPLDQGLGFLFGFARGLLLAVVKNTPRGLPNPARGANPRRCTGLDRSAVRKTHRQLCRLMQMARSLDDSILPDRYKPLDSSYTGATIQ